MEVISKRRDYHKWADELGLLFYFTKILPLALFWEKNRNKLVFITHSKLEK